MMFLIFFVWLRSLLRELNCVSYLIVVFFLIFGILGRLLLVLLMRVVMLGYCFGCML